jgi:hypothetical protein
VALWSALILVTSVEFFILARTVIFDMPLTFCETVALLAFYEAKQSENRRRRAALCLAMYLALGAGTLIKGLVALVIPGIVFFLFILLRRRWQILRRIYLIPGAGVFLAVVLPWYLQAEARNPGYLNYYLWAEHFGRYTTASFDRSEPWYYFIGVALVGFFPWTLVLPWIIKNLWRRSWDDKTVYLVLWVSVPLLFFSASHSKLPHYILPIFPALSILAGATIVGLYEQSGSKLRWVMISIWVVQSLNALYLLLGAFYPTILAHQIRAVFGHGLSPLALCDSLTGDSGLYGEQMDYSRSSAARPHLPRPGCRLERVFYVAYRSDDLGSPGSLRETNRDGSVVPPAKRGTSSIVRDVYVGIAFLSPRRATGLADHTRKQKAHVFRKLLHYWQTARSRNPMGQSDFQFGRFC